MYLHRNRCTSATWPRERPRVLVADIGDADLFERTLSLSLLLTVGSGPLPIVEWMTATGKNPPHAVTSTSTHGDHWCGGSARSSLRFPTPQRARAPPRFMIKCGVGPPGVPQSFL